MAKDIINALQEVRGTKAIGEEALATEANGIYHDIVNKTTEDDGTTARLGDGLYGSIQVMYNTVEPMVEDVIIITDNIVSINTIADNIDSINAVGEDVLKGIGTNQPTDSAILNALTNATSATADAILTAADVVSTEIDAAAASISADEAAASAAAVDLPAIEAGDATKILNVNVAEDGYDLISTSTLPISTDQQSALDLKAPIASPTFTGSITIPALDVNLPGDDSIIIDGETNVRTITVGAMRQLHKAGVPNTRAYNIEVDSNGFSDTSGIVVNFIATAMANGDTGRALSLNVDTDASTGGRIDAVVVTKSGEGSANVHGLHCGPDVAAIHQVSGVATTIETAFVYDDSLTTFTDVTTAFNTTGTNVTLFEEDNDIVYIGHSEKFSELDFILGTISSKTIDPIFEYSKGSSVWQEFTPIDSTNGMVQSGTILNNISDMTSWAIDTVNAVGSKYWVRIKRTRNTIVTSPIESKVLITVGTEYEWDEDGNLTIYNITANSIVVAGTVDGRDVATDGTKLDTVATDADVTSANETSHTDVVVDGDIGSTVQGYDANTTIQGNTFNGADQLIELDGTGRLPAVDGSQLTGLPSGFTDPMTTIGDIIFRNGSNVTARLPIGTTGQVIGTSDGVNLSFVTQSGSGDLLASNNLSDVANASTSRDNLGLTIGTDVQVYDATNVVDADVTYELLNTNGDVGTGSGQLAIGNHNHSGVYEPSDAGLTSIAGLTTLADRMIYTTASDTYAVSILTAAGRALLDDADASAQRTTLGVAIGSDVMAYDATIVVDADIGSTVQAYDADTTKNDVTNTFTLPQRGTQTTDNDGSFDMNVTNRFKCTPAGNFTLTFTNIASQGGSILLVNTGGYTVSAAATTKVSSTLLATISAAGTYAVSYESDGTNVYVTGSQGLT